LNRDAKSEKNIFEDLQAIMVCKSGVDSAAAELWKSGRSNLVDALHEDALHEVIQQAWTNETLPRS
jgi:hypothetical protein